MARARSGPSRKLIWSRASVDGAAMAAPIPWSGPGRQQPGGRLGQPAEQ